MSISSVKEKQSSHTSSISSKLSTASNQLGRCDKTNSGMDKLKLRYEKKSKRFIWLSSVYKTRHLVAFSVNQLIFSLLAVLLIESTPVIELMFLMMFNYVALSTLFLSSAISFYVLDKLDVLSVDTDKLCDDVKDFVTTGNTNGA